MTLDTRSFFVGAAGVLGILVVGFGGGVLMSGVISDSGPRQPNKIERQAVRETKPPTVEATPVPVIVATPAATPPAETPAPDVAQPAQPAPQPAPQPKPEPQPVMQAQPAPQPPQMPRRSQITVHTLGAEKPVALTQPGIEERPSRDLSRREAERLKAKQRREERAQRREEKRKQMTERRREEQLRREEMRSRSRPQQADADDDDDAPIVTRREQRPFGLPFFRMFESPD